MAGAADTQQAQAGQSGPKMLSKILLPLQSAFASLTAGSSTVVGLSIGSSSIKLAELQKKGNAWKLLHFGIVQLPEDAIVNREIVNQIAIVESIKTLLGQMRIKNKSVCTSLSGNSLIIKRMTLDVPRIRELQDQVFWEAEQYLPFDVSEVVMDYQMLSRGKDNKTEVVLVAVKRGVLDSYINCVEDAGLKAKIVDTDFFALQNLYELGYGENVSRAVALFDIGASAMKCVIVQGGIPVFTKDSALGGRTLTADIQKNLGLSYADAETLKLGGAGGTMPQEVMDLMQVMNDNLAMEIKKAIDFYNASSTGAPVEHILLAGGSSKLPNLSHVVEDVTGLPTQIINPFNAISCDPAVFSQEYLTAIAPIAAVPIGLAIRAGAGAK